MRRMIVYNRQSGKKLAVSVSQAEAAEDVKDNLSPVVGPCGCKVQPSAYCEHGWPTRAATFVMAG